MLGHQVQGNDMSVTSTHADSATARFDAAFAAFIGFCADFFAGARQGQELADRYRELSRKSTPELARIGLTRAAIPQATLAGTRY
jgi:hypothetical protein